MNAGKGEQNKVNIGEEKRTVESAICEFPDEFMRRRCGGERGGVEDERRQGKKGWV